MDFLPHVEANAIGFDWSTSGATRSMSRAGKRSTQDARYHSRRSALKPDSLHERVPSL
jgi:hypothetical protein